VLAAGDEVGAVAARPVAAREVAPIASCPRNVRRGVVLFIVVLRSAVDGPKAHPCFYHGRPPRTDSVAGVEE
jgi:hypothetical protein